MTENVDGASGACAIAIIPYGTKLTPNLTRLPLDALDWPLGRPERLMAGTVSKMGPDDHLIAYVGSRLLCMPRPGVRARMSVLGAIPNGHRFLFGSTWTPDWRTTDTSKSRMLSLIASQKTHYEGHRLRHRTVEWVNAHVIEADILGRGHAVIERKSDGLAPYRYSIIIENVRETSYFTENLIDCLLCDTVPIYWGAPDIEAIFDELGMMLCRSFEDIQKAIVSVSEDDYQSRLEYIANTNEKASRCAAGMRSRP